MHQSFAVCAYYKNYCSLRGWMNTLEKNDMPKSGERAENGHFCNMYAWQNLNVHPSKLWLQLKTVRLWKNDKTACNLLPSPKPEQ